MRAHKVLAAAAAVLALGVVLLTDGTAADEKELRAAMDKLVETAAKSPDDLPKAGAALAKAHNIDNDSIKDVMDLLGRRDDKSPGWGVGKAGTIKPDNIEMKLREIVRDRPAMTKAQLTKEAPALVELANRTAAVAAVGLASPPKKKLPDKDPKDWKESSEDAIKASRELAKVAAEKEPDLAVVKQAVAKLNSACSSCHGKFRD